jgi:hypothetical protein
LNFDFSREFGIAQRTIIRRTKIINYSLLIIN